MLIDTDRVSCAESVCTITLLFCLILGAKRAPHRWGGGKNMRKCETEHIKTKEFLLNLGFLMFKSPKGKLITKQKRSFWGGFPLSWWTFFRVTAQNIPAPSLNVDLLEKKENLSVLEDKIKWQKGKGGFDLKHQQLWSFLPCFLKVLQFDNDTVSGLSYHVLNLKYVFILFLPSWDQPSKSYSVVMFS